MKTPEWVAGRIVATADEREQWLVARERYVTASDVGKAMSIPWTVGKQRTPGPERYEYLMERKLSGEEMPRNAYMWWGSELEPYVIERLALSPSEVMHGWDIRQALALVEDPQCKYLAATTDMWMDDGNGPMCGDLKISSYAWKPSKNKPTPDMYVPRDYQLQIQAQMACTGAERGCLVQFLGNHVANCIVYRRDEGVIARIRQAAEMFMVDLDSRRVAAE